MDAMATVEQQLAALRTMSPKELRRTYAELHGERSRSGNRQWLLRRCAWRLQALVEGGLSDRAKRRAAELACDQDLRMLPPRAKAACADGAGDVERSVVGVMRRARDGRLPLIGGVLSRVYQGKEYVVEVLENGFGYDGKRYLSLSAVAHAITGTHWNGFRFFNCQDIRKEAE